MDRLQVNTNIFLMCITCVFYASVVTGDIPCAARPITGMSVICLCNETYCDTITRIPPKENQYIVYTSSKGGLRFNKTIGHMQDKDASCQKSHSLTLNPDTKYQTIEGFGGAVTDSAGINWKSLPKALQQALIKSYFSDDGLQYNMIRVPIAGSDFSTHPYAYNELPVNDTKLTNFSLSYEDYNYKLPFIKAAMQVVSTRIKIVATPWSPPGWMKTKNNISGGFLRPEYYKTFADYIIKFIDEYEKEGVKTWAITTTNEPFTGLLNLLKINSMAWTASTMGNWIANYLGPMMQDSKFSNVSILTCDDQRISIPYWFNLVVAEYPEVLKYINGLAVHYYTDSISPAFILDTATKNYPDKIILATEASEGSDPWQESVVLGSWTRAQKYISDIITDLTHNVVGWIDWNLCLDLQGGPNWIENYVDSSIIVFPKKRVFAKQPMFYAQGHVSKFVPRGSRRIEVVENKLFWSKSLQNVAFLTPYNTVVIVIHNTGKSLEVCINMGEKQAIVTLPQKSISTVEMAYA